MYSVLIQNKKTMESFSKFHPLFTEALSKGEIGVCQWMEAGTTPEVTLPELLPLVEEKEAWRAVIVRIQDEEEMAHHPSARLNPYDFYENADWDGEIQENPVPLVRLTHMLGGIPVPEVRFQTKIIKEDRMNPRVIYEPVPDPEKVKAHQKLSAKYKLKAKAPEDILLVTLCERPEAREDFLKHAWENREELESSSFWKRNQFPGSCRFLFCEEKEEGEVQNTADLFHFWSGVLLLAKNSLNSSTLQSYRLYRMEVEFDRKAMARVMQESAERAGSGIRLIEAGLRREAGRGPDQGQEIPDYHLSTPVEFHVPEKKDFYVSRGDFKLFAASGKRDTVRWVERRMLSDRAVQSAMTRAERALDQSAERVRRFYAFEEEDTRPLSPYAEMDMEDELDRLLEDIFDQRSALSGSSEEQKKEKERLDKNVRDTISFRLTKEWGMMFLGATALFCVCCMAPALILLLQEGWGSLQGMLFDVAVFVAVLAVIELSVLIVRRQMLNGDIADYNRFVHGMVVHISENASAYSRYMSGIASYMRGNSYLSQMKKKSCLRDEEKYQKENHIIALKRYRENLKRWCEALHLPVSVDASHADANLFVDVRIPPSLNPLYTFENGESYVIPLNHTGDTVDAPFCFMRRLTITREELYDDASRD